jgi:hypothetical protein
MLVSSCWRGPGRVHAGRTSPGPGLNRTQADSLGIRRILTCGYGLWHTGRTNGIDLRINAGRACDVPDRLLVAPFRRTEPSTGPAPITLLPTYPKSGSSDGRSSAVSSTNTSESPESPVQGLWPSSGTHTHRAS